MTRWKHTAYRIARWVFFAASLAYLVVFARDAVLGSDRNITDLLRASIGETVLAAMLFLVAALLSVTGWRALLQALAHGPLPLRPLLQVFCTTQIAKYLPGNIGHHLGRVALVRTRLGVPAMTTTLSILQEGALVVASALLVGTACFFIAPPALPTFGNVPTQWLLVAMLVAGFGTLAVINATRGRLHARAHGAVAWMLRAAPAWPAVRGALPPYVAIQLLNGAGVTCIAAAMTHIGPSEIALLTGAYSLAWMVGFLLPGAPGGLGVRESSFLVLVANAFPPEVAFGIVVLSRVGNIAADALIFLGGALAGSTGDGPSAAHSPH